MITLLLSLLFVAVGADEHSRILYSDIFKSGRYNKLIRPVGDNTDKLVVSVGLRLISIIDVDEKNQIMTTNVWLEQSWTDYKLRWEPDKHGDVRRLYVPPDVIWLPDIILYNSADGNFTINVMTKATIHYTGRVTWSPPAVYKSLCLIDVEFFPFDQQLCILKIGSWSYDGNLVDIKHIQLPDGVDDLQTVEQGINLTDYGPSTEWDLLAVPSKKSLKFYPCCSEPFPDLKFHITIRRKTLYHTVNLILPCVAICGLTVFVFFVPSLSGEKITMAITILNSLNIFLLLVAEINPPTSLATPLVGKYLLFTMVLVTCSIIVTVFVLNVHFRSPSTHSMSPFVANLFLQVLPKLLFMQRPGDKRKELQKKLKLTGNNIMMSRKHVPEMPFGRKDDVTSLITRDLRKKERGGKKDEGGGRMGYEGVRVGDNVRVVKEDMYGGSKDSKYRGGRGSRHETRSFDARHQVMVAAMASSKYDYYCDGKSSLKGAKRKGGTGNIRETGKSRHAEKSRKSERFRDLKNSKDRKYSGKVRFETGNSKERPEKEEGEIESGNKKKEDEATLAEKRKRLRLQQQYVNDNYDDEEEEEESEEEEGEEETENDYDDEDENKDGNEDEDEDEDEDGDRGSSIAEIWFHNQNQRSTNNNDNNHSNNNHSNNNPSNNNKHSRNKGNKHCSLPAPLMQAVYGVNFIAEHIEEQDAAEKVKEDWMFVSVIMDRLFMWIFAAFCGVGTCSIILQAPMLYDTRVPIG